MHRTVLKKPDGRELILYSRTAIAPGIVATSPPHDDALPNPHLRWHPVRGEWVAYASHRQNRVFLPPRDSNPLAPTRDPARPTELPAGFYDVAVFENLSPALTRHAEAPPDVGIPSLPARGACEVVVFTTDDAASLGSLSLSHLSLIFEVWAERTRELGARDDVQYVLPFENRGVEMGVTLHHPHGQIYAYPFLPPVPARMLGEARRFFLEHETPLVSSVVRRELSDGLRLLYAGLQAVAFVPAFARYPYEVWVAPRRSVSSLNELGTEERADLARALKTTLLKYDKLWDRPFPYLMTLYQAPTDGETHPEWHFHLELSPALRAPHRLKYLAGTELGAGMFANDRLPEETAEELREVPVIL